jgi:hypothetical protein
MKEQNKSIRVLLITLLILFLTLSLVSCADTEVVDNCVDEKSTYGFWGGLWHGIIAPISFFGALIWDDISMYALNNNGGWYDFGFILGVGGLTFGSGRKSS